MNPTRRTHSALTRELALLISALLCFSAAPALADEDDEKPKKKKPAAAKSDSTEASESDSEAPKKKKTTKKAAASEDADKSDDSGANTDSDDTDDSKSGLEVIPGVDWVKGPATGKLGSQAEIVVPEGFVFAEGDGTRKVLQMMGNLTGDSEVGLLAPMGDTTWFIVFDFDNSGYVKDDEKDKLDADAMMKAMKEGNKHANDARKTAGLSALELVGWERPPHYNAATNNLEWAKRLRAEGDVTINYSIRLLGREGVMSADLVLGPEALDATLPKLQALLGGFSYVDGRRYADWKSGDKIAEYGLTALIAGGGAALALKTGLLQKFWKVIVAGIVGIGALLKKVFGRKSE